MKFGISVETTRARERRQVERLVGDQPLRRRALWVERSVAVVVLVTCLLGAVGGVLAVRAVDRGSGRHDQRITATTTSAAQVDFNRPTATGSWVADVSWTDPMGTVHRGHVSVARNVPVGTQVPARLAADGAVRSTPDSAFDVWCVAVMVCVGIAVVVLALGLITYELLSGLAERIRLSAWQAAWAQWQPKAPNHEEL